MQQRSRSRFPVQCAVQFRGAHLLGGGMVLDLSENGAKVVSDRGIEYGMQLKLKIYVRPHTLPVTIELATVRWVNGQEFGLEFLSMQAEELGRLLRCIPIA